MLTDLDSSDPLAWLSRILWPDGSTVLGPTDPAPPRTVGRGPTAGGWWASPTPHEPRILIPAASPAAARTAVRRYHDGFDWRRRLRSVTAEATMAAGPLGRRPLRARTVGVLDGSAGHGVLEALADVLDIPDLRVAISLSVPKSNQKPVLQLLDDGGRCHGWAKVAWNDRTDALVGTEARWLTRSPLPPLVMPRLILDRELCGRRVVVTSGVTPSRLPDRAADRLPPLGVFRAVTGLGTLDTVPVTGSTWWRTVESVLDHASAEERRLVESVAADCGRRTFRVGAWHGDLTPWNLMTTADGVQLIDWEFAADGVPMGFDLCHFHTQVAVEQKGHDARGALDHSARLSPQGLAALGIDPANRTMVWRLYLVELVRRLLALRADGYPTGHVTHGRAALERLTRLYPSADRAPNRLSQGALHR